MSTTQDEHKLPDKADKSIKEKLVDFNREGYTYEGSEYSLEGLINRARGKDNPFALDDYNVIIKVFEVEASRWTEEDYALAYHYKDVHGTQNFAGRVREQLARYPGMHRANNNAAATNDPFYRNAKEKSSDRLGFWNSAMDGPTELGQALRSRKKDFDYTKIFGSDVSAEERAKNIGMMLKECVPCFDRLLDGMSLLPDGDLLEVHALNVKVRFDLLDDILDLFNDPGMYIDTCELLKLLSGLCPQDLYAMLVLLTQYLAKINLDVRFNLDFILQLIGPILSPFLDSISEWLDKWVQLILGPMICVVDHMNEVIIMTQNAKIPFSDVSGNISSDIGIAGPFHGNLQRTSEVNVGTGGPDGPGAGIHRNWDAFTTPDAQKYNPTKPSFPTEETSLGFREGVDGLKAIKTENAFFGNSEQVSKTWAPGISEGERERRDKKWRELRLAETRRRKEVPPPLDYSKRDGTRWSKDDIPQSEKYHKGNGHQKGAYYPPEKQRTPKAEGKEYYIDAGPLANSIIQLRNIVQSSIQYIKDWFTFITQMIYDLLGVDFGWMQKKTDTTALKTKLIQMIAFIKAIIEAMADNGLECGINSNFSPAQLQYITTKVLADQPGTNHQFKVQPNGEILFTKGGSAGSSSISTPREVKDNSGVDKKVRQKSTDSSIIIKSCFKDVSSDDLDKVRDWITDFEERSAV